MKIVPVLTSKGQKYKVVKSSILGSKFLSDKGQLVRRINFLKAHFFPPMMFSAVDEAIKEIKKQFGETEEIRYWSGQ